jgi:DNA-directed RNA polymerase subunit RPC12/RpoP
MTVSFRCGHKAIDVKAEVNEPPRCPECGERVVSRVTNAVPRFKGACKGPLVKQT